jgi:hypothetical protein
MDTSGFYYNEDGNVIHGPSFVLNMDFELRRESKDDHTYPVHGWHWFDSQEEAYAFFELPLPEKTEIIEGAPDGL